MSFRAGKPGLRASTGELEQVPASARKGAGPGRLIGTSDSAPRSRPTLEADPKVGRSGASIHRHSPSVAISGEASPSLMRLTLAVVRRAFGTGLRSGER